MNSSLTPVASSWMQALEKPLQTRALAPEQVISGVASVGITQIDFSPKQEIGIWEISPSITVDVETDEVFVVIAGRATVTFEHSGEQMPLSPGVVAKLTAGTRTTWNVTERLRKVYFLSPDFERII